MILLINSHAQTYQKIFNGHKQQWNIMEEIPDVWITKTFESREDTIFNGLVFHRCKSDWTGILDTWFLEDIDGKIIVAMPAGQDTFGRVVCNMNLALNDTFDLHEEFGSNKKTTPVVVDSVWMENGRKHIQFNFILFQNRDSLGNLIIEKLMFIEGIGPNIGLFYCFGGFQSFFIPSSYLLCMTSDTVQIYSNKFFNGNCNLTLGGINDLKSSSISITPNPFQQYATVQLPPNVNQATYLITAMSGKTVKEMQTISGNSFRIERHNLPAGVYLLRIEMLGERPVFGKLVVGD